MTLPVLVLSCKGGVFSAVSVVVMEGTGVGPTTSGVGGGEGGAISRSRGLRDVNPGISMPS